ncbi:MAG: hypothetical protein NZ843_02570 [Fimbriimonadales bacterium]|nr:hypothetical protein [Fimbriimonadales bacterium]
MRLFYRATCAQRSTMLAGAGKLLSALCVLLLTACGLAQPITVEAEGVAELGASREEAIRVAQRHALMQAVETACGVRLAGLEVGRDGELQLAARLAFAQGVVLRWTMLGAPQIEQGSVRVRVRAEVLPTAQLTTAADWREVWRTVGHPPIGLHWQFSGDLALETPTRERLHALLQESLQAMGVRLLERAPASAWRLVAEVRLVPRKRWDDTDAPYDTGDLFASWQVHLTLTLMPPAGAPRPPLDPTHPHTMLLRGEATGVSCLSDADAVAHALQKLFAQHDTDAWRTQIAQAWVNYLLYTAQPTIPPHPKEVRKNATNTAARSQPAARRHATGRSKRR